MAKKKIKLKEYEVMLSVTFNIEAVDQESANEKAEGFVAVVDKAKFPPYSSESIVVCLVNVDELEE